MNGRGWGRVRPVVKVEADRRPGGNVEDKLNYLENPIPAAYVPAQELKTLFEQQTKKGLLQTVREFYTCKQEEGQSVSLYVLKMKSYIDNLELLSHLVSLNLAVSLILVSLRKEYDSFMQNYNMHDMGKTVNELHAILKLHEQTLPKKDASALHAIRTSKVQKKNNKNKKPQLAARGNNQGNGSLSLLMLLSPRFPLHQRKKILLKTQIRSYLKELVLQGLRESRKLKAGALSLYMCNGQREAVEDIGSYHLFFPSGLVIILHNCHFAPSIIRGVISVSRLYDDGFINRFKNNAIFVSRNNVVYFFAIPKDGIYEIDLSNSNTNDSSMYVVSNKRAKLNLDFSLLWHCRLGHISKKRIEKLQQDGLLNSTDIKSFEKCVSCMSGKIARKPYSHQVERAKYLLGLIHTDHGIISHRTLPYTPQHNGMLERRNRTLLDMVRSMMSQTTLPKSFWDYALESAERILNMVPTKKVEKTPYENKVFIARNAEFFENSLITQEASGSLKDLEISQEEDTHPSVNTSSHHDEDDQEINEPQSDINPIHPEYDKWLNDMNVEMQSMKDNEVWDLVNLPPNGKTIGSKWLFKKKTDIDVAVATGFTQTYEVDYEENFSPVADIRAIRILIAITAFYDYEIWQIDIKLPSLIDISQKKSIWCNLKQASRQWNNRFDDEIKKFGFNENRDEPCVYMKASGSNVTFLIVYVDDIFIMGNHILMLQDVKSYLGKCFAMNDLGEAAYILGIKILRDRSRRLIGLCQSAYIEKILKRFYMKNSKRESIPMQEKLKLSKSQGASTPAENITSRFQQNPGELPRTAVKNILKYLRNTKDMFLVYGGVIKQELKVSCYTDARYLTDADDLKSQTGYVFVLNGGVVDWRVQSKGSSQLHLQKLRPITIANESGITKGARHYRAKVYYLHEVIEFGYVKIEKIHTDDNLANPFTKALPFPNHS
ncbi:retrotransposon protein, putative, ty1-copia subclass [Tanacetum coccineum]|uniref:Retrotransposon protein, putative, ty1-copia subclass n=1 Tax=Tanacetum coccineum TaxID=301880 RepID=A0ABQ4XLX9_9ASTR